MSTPRSGCSGSGARPAARRPRRRACALVLAAFAVTAGCAMQAPAPAPVPSQQEPGPAPPQKAPGMSSAPADLVPASLAASSPAASGASSRCLAEIESFAERHSGNRVMLGPAAFAGNDQLVLTRIPRRGPDGRLLDGRAAPPQPLVLKLLAGPQGCFLQVADDTASPVAVPACSCLPLR